MAMNKSIGGHKMGSGTAPHYSNKTKPCEKKKASSHMMGMWTKEHNSNVAPKVMPPVGAPGSYKKGNA